MSRASRPVRGVAVLLAGAAAAWLIGAPSFAVPSQLVASEVALAQGASAADRAAAAGLPALGGARFDRAQRPAAAAAAPEGRLAGDSTTSPVSMMLAAAGCATAMRAAAAAADAAETEEEPAKEKSFMDKFGVLVYIGMWYFFNIGYNIYNKKALIAYPYPWACALWQMAFGWLIFVPLWLLKIRKTPKLSVQQAITLAPAAMGHLATHVGAVIAFFAGAVSFGHIVKASEPVISSILNFAFMGEVNAWQVYAALIPIIGGVGLASASEMSFNWLCFGAAMGSNLGSASRAVYSKMVMGKGNIGENMDSANVYAVLTIMATFMLIPISFAIEGPSAMIAGFKVALAKGGMPFIISMLYSGLFYYLYNEVAFLALGKLDPVSHAVCNTMKRVVIIVTAIIVFKTPVTPLGVAGSSIAILGTLLYSMAKNKYPSK